MAETDNTIIITNRYLEMALNSPIFGQLRQKRFPVKAGYWLARSFDKIIQLAKVYQEEKKKLLEKYSKEKDEQGNLKVESDGSILLEDPEEFAKEFEELLSIEINLGVNKIKVDFDKFPDLTIDEMELLLPLLEE